MYHGAQNHSKMQSSAEEEDEDVFSSHTIPDKILFLPV
jgi:hypothetical protein